MIQYLCLNLCRIKLSLAFLNKFKISVYDYKPLLKQFAKETKY